MFYEDLSCPKLLGNTNWVFPNNPDFYTVNDSGNQSFYESKLLKVSKTSDVLYATFSETNEEVIAEIQLYSRDYKPTQLIRLRNNNEIVQGNITYGFINNLSIRNPITFSDYWYKIIIKSNISSLKIFGI